MSDEKLARKREVDAAKVRVWQQAIQAGLKAKDAYRSAAEEVMSYFKMTHERLFSSGAVKANFVDFEDKGLGVSVNKAALVRAVLGPHLYQQNPKREVNAKRKDAVAVALARVIEEYLDYSVRESKLAPQIRKSIDDALLRGAGFLRTGYDDDRGIITSWHVSSMRVVIDPAAHSLDDARWIAISSRLPLREVKARYGEKEKWRVEGLKSGGSAPEAQDFDELKNPSGYLSDQVIVWEVYSKDGNGLHMGPDAPDAFKDDEDSNDYVKLAIVFDHDRPLEEGDWEIPLYLDREWPVVMLQFVETLDQLWPESVMGQALIHQKALDLLSSLEMNAAKIHARDVYFYRADMLTDEDKAQLLSGGPSVAIPLGQLQPGQKPADVVYRADLGVQTPEVRLAREWHNQQFELVTGATPVLQGVSDQAQDRSATASAQKRQAANSRLGDMLSKVEEFCTSAARNEALTCRLGKLVTAKEVAQAVGDIDLGFRYDFMPLKNEKRTPLRFPLRGKGLTMEVVFPPAATYFENAEQAQVFAQAVWAGLLKATGSADAEIALAASLLVQTLVLETGGDLNAIPPSVAVRPVTAEDVYYDTKGISPKQMVREYEFSIQAGTTQKVDPTLKREYADLLVSQWAPAAFKVSDYRTLNWIKEAQADAYGIPPDERGPTLVPPPPPPPAPSGASPAPLPGGPAP